MLLHQFVVIPTPTTLDRVLLWPANYGWFGVTLFFVLSGYLITGVLLDTRDAPNRTSSFYARRALRILPLYFVLLAGVFGISAATGGAFGVADLTPIESASFWLLLGNGAMAAAGGFLVGVLAVTWSVAIEEQFYLVWPWVVWSLSPRRLAWFCGIVVTACLVARLVAQANGASELALYVSTWTRIDALAIGAAAALVARHQRAGRLSNRTLVIGLLGFGTIAAGGDLLAEINHGDARYFCTAWSLGPGITLGAIACGALLLLIVRADGPRWLTRALEAGWLRSWGTYSYGVYLTHGPVRAFVRDHLFGPGLDGAAPLVRFPTVGGSLLPALLVYTAICLPLCWAVGWLSYRLIERPCLRLKHRFPAAPHPR